MNNWIRLSQSWPAWLKVIFKISAALFLISIFLMFAFEYQSQIVYFDTPPVLLIDPVKGQEVAANLTLITLLLTPLSGAWGHVLALRKANVELEIVKIKLELEQKEAPRKKPRKAPPKKVRRTK